MATDEETQNPFTRPGFVAAAVVIALVVVLGVIVAIVNATSSEPDPEPVPSSTTTATSTTTAPSTTHTISTDGGEASICKLGGKSDEVPVSAPEALWKYQGTTAYPTSETYGPREDDPAGFRFCFQHSPTGALFMAANAITQGSDPAVSSPWIDYAAAEGLYRDELVSDVTGGGTEAKSRYLIQGFRILGYDEESARIDVAIRASGDGTSIYVSAVYELVWQDGDWKLSTDTLEPLKTAPVPDLAGYIAWGE